jgi:ribosomal protein S18 acetylase RimI-like enzyme
MTSTDPAGRTRGARTTSALDGGGVAASTESSRSAPTEPSRLGPLEPRDRAAIEPLLRATGFFRDTEIDIALEVLDAYFDRPDRDYSALGAFTLGGELIGYVCYGPTPCTTGTYDLYWIAVAPAAQNGGVGTILVQEVERRLAEADARLVIVETSSQPLYEPTRAFYVRKGYAEVARVPDFYADGDDRVIFAKRIHPLT